MTISGGTISAGVVSRGGVFGDSQSAPIEVNSDNSTSTNFVDGVNWTDMRMTASKGGSQQDGSYLGDAAKFNDRRLVGSNGSAVMVGAAPFDADTIQFLTPENESTIRTGFDHPERFILSPDVWYMNGDFDNSPWVNGVRFSPNVMTASGALGSGDRPGNYLGRGSLLVGKTFRGGNGAEITVTGSPAASNIEFTTSNSDAEVRTGFDFPGMWQEV